MEVYARSISFHLGTNEEGDQCLQLVLPQLMQDVSWFTSAVAFSLAFEKKPEMEIHALRYYNKAIQELNRRLSTPLDCASDGVLMTITSLISYAVFNRLMSQDRALLMPLQMQKGDLQAVRSHLQGMKQLVDLRGGLDNITAFDGYLRERIAG